MLWTIFVVLLILWLLGFSFHTASGSDSNLSFPMRAGIACVRDWLR